MYIRKAEKSDIPALCALYAEARGFMKAHGNPHQWGDSEPALETVEQDVDEQVSYVCIDAEPGAEGAIIGVFACIPGADPAYRVIYGGGWLDDAPYCAVHRVATAAHRRGVGAFCLAWCSAHCGTLRIDTHRDNAPMRNLLTKLGYRYCGTIRLMNGDERLAFQKQSSRSPSIQTSAETLSTEDSVSSRRRITQALNEVYTGGYDAEFEPIARAGLESIRELTKDDAF